jgi:STE24 endopeptidase
LDSVPQDKREKSDAYFEGGYWLLLWNYLVAAAISILMLSTRISARLRDLSERLTKYKTLHIAGYSVLYLLLVYVLSFPLNVYEHFVREHQYGLATQSFAAWFREQLIGVGITLLGGTIFFILLYAAFRRAPKTWSIWGAAVTVVFSFVLVFIAPVFIEPLFNTYKPLTKPEISEPILAMARANEIPVKQVFEVDASRQTTRVSANVSGFLGTTRIALNDNLLRRAALPEVEAVMGHEMGHFVLHHVSKSMLFFGVVLVIGFAFLRWGFERAAARWGEGWGIRGVADPAGLPLLAALLAIYFFVLTPVIKTHIRTEEAEADIFGLNAARQPDGMAEAALHLAEYRKMSPGPIEEWIFFDHPSGRTRIFTSMRWKAEHPETWERARAAGGAPQAAPRPTPEPERTDAR